MLATLIQAWRNLWRNRRRTAITILAVALGTTILVLTRGLIDGMVRQSIGNATNLSVGEVQVHAPGYLADRSLYKPVSEPDRVMASARDHGIPVAPRSYGYGLVAREAKSAGALFWGIDPALEAEAFDLPAHVAEGKGDFLAAAAAGGVVLGRKLARSLDARVGSEVVVVVQAADGSLGNEIYTVTGILKAVGAAIDRSAAILHKDDFDDLFVSGGRIHELAFNTRGAVELERLEAVVGDLAGTEEVRTWRELMPMLSDMLAMMDGALWIFGSIFFIAAGLGVMNTMLMATYERIHEFGVMKALGASPWRIVTDVALEAWLLALVSTVIGAALGLWACQWLATHGIDTSRWAGETSFAGVAFDPIWRATVRPGSVVVPVAMMWLTSVAAALYPAILAARLDPVEAIGRV